MIARAAPLNPRQRESGLFVQVVDSPIKGLGILLMLAGIVFVARN